MKPNLHRKFFAAAAALLFAANLLAADTNSLPGTMTRDEAARNYLQIQEQIHATQLAIEQAQQSATAAAKSNAEALANRLQSLEQSVSAQRAVDTESTRKTQQLTLFLAGAFGVAGLGVLLLMTYFQWRAFSQLAKISSQPHGAISVANGVHQLAAPGRVTVETSNDRLLGVVGQLEKRIHELEDGQKVLPEPGTTKDSDAPAQAQKYLDGNQPQRALDELEKFLSSHPQHAEAFVKKAVALEKLGRTEEALASCDRAIKVDGALAVAHLQKGGLLNRLRRYDEALDCFEKALVAQEKKSVKV
jgi:tetratricopeptide (TPR) repeat protein